MLEFINPGLAYVGLGLMALPVIIHLINLMRHRRVEWAAMEFLLESKRRNSAYVMLKQLLLLLMRMAAIAALALILGQLLFRAQWLGEGPVHHIVLVDDSYSMSDRGSDGRTAMDAAKRAIGRLCADAQQRTQQVLTIWRSSEPKADLQQKIIGLDFATEVEPYLGGLQPSDLAGGLEPALARIRKEFGDARGERRIVYLISDFRNRDWSEPAETVRLLKEIQQDGTEVVLIRCAEQARQNLGVVEVKLSEKTRAVDLGIPVDVTIRNFGPAPAENVTVALLVDNQPFENFQIPKIAVGESVVRTREVRFASAGDHSIAFKLPADAVGVDNVRTATVAVPVKVECLVIDADPALRDGNRLALMLSPGGDTNTGLAPVVEPPSVLSSRDLGRFASIYLCNVSFLPESVVEKLDKFVTAGGGLCFLLGDKTDAPWVNSALYKQGKGLFPAPIGAPAELVLDRLNPAPDVQAQPHPMFRGLSGLTNSPLDAVLINKYVTVEPSWKPTPDSRVSIAAKLRNGAPLILEKTVGSGKVVAILNPGREPWSNWHTNLSFLLALLDLQAHLTASNAPGTSYLAGATIRFDFEAGRFSETVGIVVPPPRNEFGESAPGAAEVAEVRQATRKERQLEIELPTPRAGLYEIRLGNVEGASLSRKFAANVLPDEGDPTLVASAALDGALKEVKYQVQDAEQVQEVAGQANERNFSEWILYALILLLLGEQVMAYFVSYHAPTTGGRA